MRQSEPTLRSKEERMCIIVPSLNEESTVGRVVQDARAAFPEATVLVVSDGSTDATAAEARAAGALVVELPFNLGIGGAVQTGYMFARRHGFTCAIQIDGDGQHASDELQFLLDPIRSGSADITVGSRWRGRGAFASSLDRRVGMLILAALVNWRTHQQFTDTTSGFRAVNERAIDLFAQHYPIDFPEVESIVHAKSQNLRVAEVPVMMAPRTAGRSSIHGMRSVYYMIRVTLGLLVGHGVRGDTT